MNAINKYHHNIDIHQGLTPVQELRIFIQSFLVPLKKKLIEIGGGGIILDQDINPIYDVIKAIDFISDIGSALHYDDTMEIRLLENIFDKIDFIVDEYQKIEGNVEILQEALRQLKIKTSINIEGSVVDDTTNIYYLSTPKNPQRLTAERAGLVRKLMLGSSGPTMPSSQSKRDEALGRIKKAIPEASGMIKSTLLADQIQNNNLQPEKIETPILESIMKRSIKNQDYEMLGSLEHYMKYEAANEKIYDTNIENAQKFSKHIKNIRPGSPITLKTTKGDIQILNLVPFFPTHERVRVYHKADIIFQGRKRKVLIREDLLEVGNTTEILGDFDKNGKFVPATKGINTFSIQRIYSNKPQYQKIEPTLTQKVAKTLTSVKDKFMNLFK